MVAFYGECMVNESTYVYTSHGSCDHLARLKILWNANDPWLVMNYTTNYTLYTSNKKSTAKNLHQECCTFRQSREGAWNVGMLSGKKQEASKRYGVHPWISS